MIPYLPFLKYSSALFCMSPVPAVDDVFVYMGRHTLHKANLSMYGTIWQDVFPEILYCGKEQYLEI